MILLASDVTFLWGLLDMGLDGCFALSIITVLDQLPHPVSAGALTSLMQTGEFIIVAFVPLCVAGIQQLRHSFTWI